MSAWDDGLPGSIDPFGPGEWGDGLPLGPAKSGPRVVSAACIDIDLVRLTFNEEVRHSSSAAANDSLNPSNYAFTGGITATSVVLNQANPTIVEITVTPEMQNINYTVTVTNVENLAGNIVDPLYNFATYLGINTGEARNFIAEILVGYEVIWSAQNSLPQQNLSLDVRRFQGKLPLTFRIRGTS